jgi:hypothetical protein
MVMVIRISIFDFLQFKHLTQVGDFSPSVDSGASVDHYNVLKIVCIISHLIPILNQIIQYSFDEKKIIKNHWYISDLWLKYLESTISGLLKIDNNVWCNFRGAMLYVQESWEFKVLHTFCCRQISHTHH